MLQESVIPIPFTEGIDTKSDPKAVRAGKFLRMENGVFTNPQRISKRNGYNALGTTVSGIGSLSAPQMVNGYNNELIAADQNLLLSYSPNQNAWYYKGEYTSCELTRMLISEDISSTGISDTAILGNYQLIGYSDSNGDIYGTVLDINTSDILLKFIVYSNGSPSNQNVRCVLIGGTTLGLVYQKGTADYYARTVVFGGSAVVSFSAEVKITTNADNNLFDICSTATGAAFTYEASGNAVIVGTLSSSLAVTSASGAGGNGQENIAISITSNGNIWVYWNETTVSGSSLTSSTIYYRVYSSTLSPVLTKTTLKVLASPYAMSSIIAVPVNATQQLIYYGQYVFGDSASSGYTECTKYISATSTGTIGAEALFANGVIPFSKYFIYGSRIYAAFIYRATDNQPTVGGTIGASVQPTVFIAELITPTTTPPPYVVARFGAGVASSTNLQFLSNIYMQNIAAFGTSKFYMTCGIIVQEATSKTTSITGLIGVYSYAFDFASPNAYIARNCGGISVLNGGILQMYDGANCVELGFNLFPEITNAVQVDSGGLVGNGEYNYIAIYQWIDNQGNLHQSEPSLVSGITVSGLSPDNTGSVVLSVTTAFLSQKQNASVAVYRTTGQGSSPGIIYYLVETITDLADASADPNAFVTITDTLQDPDLIKNNQAYTYPGSAILENNTPPPSVITISHNNRLFFVDSENPNTIGYSKSNFPGTGLSISNFLIEQIDSKFGNISGLAELDANLVIAKPNGFLIQAGDGANDAGQGSTFSFPQVIPSDVGVTVLKSIISTPRGIMFKSTNGIYMLDRSLSVSYIGAEVEAYNSQVITAATLVPGKSQIRFLCSSGLALVYDYIFNQWSTFTNHTGTSSSTWNNLYVYATTGGNVFLESIGQYLDNATPFSLLLQTSWLSLASIQGFQRVKRFIMLGDFINGASAAHNLQVSGAYDFSSTFQAAIQSPALGIANASSVFQYRERLPIQKCDSISLLIQENTTGDINEYVDITNMSFEAGVKRGVNKLSGVKSVG